VVDHGGSDQRLAPIKGTRMRLMDGWSGRHLRGQFSKSIRLTDVKAPARKEIETERGWGDGFEEGGWAVASPMPVT
jgi:hypothetical protein